MGREFLTMNNLSARWFAAGLVVLWSATIYFMWSPRPYWPDADGYAFHMIREHWVAHPPGYALFIILGRFFLSMGCGPYLAVQMASFSLTVAGLAVLYRLLRELLEVPRALAFTGGAAFSWIILLNAQTGTSHASDLLSVSLLLWAAMRLPGKESAASWSCDLSFAAALFVCAGFRLNTLIMLAPLCLLVAWQNRGRLSFWISCAAGAVVIIAWQIGVIVTFGGWDAYAALAASMNAGNSASSILLQGVTAATILNIGRAFFWVALGTLTFWLACWGGAFQGLSPKARLALIYGLAAFLGPLLAAACYLCTHPGLVVSTVPAAALCAAAMVSPTPARWAWKPFTAAAVATVLLLFLVSPIVPPSGKYQAVANGVFLQYSVWAAREGVFRTTSGWLREAGLGLMLPEHRRNELEHGERWRQHFERIDPSR